MVLLVYGFPPLLVYAPPSQGYLVSVYIQDFERTYKGSEEEREDVMQLYEQHQGEMDAILASALCCSQEDESRLADIIHAAIQAGEAASYPAFTQEDDRRKRARRQKVG